MILDFNNRFSDAQAVTATAVSDDIIDLGEARNIGVGENLYILVVVDVAFTDSGDDTTIVVTIETDDNESFSSATVGQTLFTFDALSAIGTTNIARIQPDAANERFMRLRYTIANGSLTTGSLSSYILHDISKWTAYADNITIS